MPTINLQQNPNDIQFCQEAYKNLLIEKMQKGIAYFLENIADQCTQEDPSSGVQKYPILITLQDGTTEKVIGAGNAMRNTQLRGNDFFRFKRLVEFCPLLITHPELIEQIPDWKKVEACFPENSEYLISYLKNYFSTTKPKTTTQIPIANTTTTTQILTTKPTTTTQIPVANTTILTTSATSIQYPNTNSNAETVSVNKILVNMMTGIGLAGMWGMSLYYTLKKIGTYLSRQTVLPYAQGAENSLRIPEPEAEMFYQQQEQEKNNFNSTFLTEKNPNLNLKNPKHVTVEPEPSLDLKQGFIAGFISELTRDTDGSPIISAQILHTGYAIYQAGQNVWLIPIQYLLNLGIQKTGLMSQQNTDYLNTLIVQIGIPLVTTGLTGLIPAINDLLSYETGKKTAKFTKNTIPQLPKCITKTTDLCIDFLKTPLTLANQLKDLAYAVSTQKYAVSTQNQKR